MTFLLVLAVGVRSFGISGRVIAIFNKNLNLFGDLYLSLDIFAS